MEAGDRPPDTEDNPRRWYRQSLGVQADHELIPDTFTTNKNDTIADHLASQQINPDFLHPYIYIYIVASKYRLLI